MRILVRLMKMVRKDLEDHGHGPFEKSSVAEAVQAFPNPIFTRWLRLRRHSADLYLPEWRKLATKEGKIALLDEAAAIQALMN